MFVAERRVFSEEDTISPATISLCLSNQGRKSQLWSRATPNGPRKMGRVVKEMQKKDGREELHQSLTCKKTMTKLKGIHIHVCSWKQGLLKKDTISPPLISLS